MRQASLPPTPRVMKYRLYHLMEDDRLTCYLTLIGGNILKYVEVMDPAAAGD